MSRRHGPTHPYLPSPRARARMTPREWKGLAGFVLVVAAVATGASLATITAPDDYEALRGPTWAPPTSLFGPVWTLLYATIALSGWLAWKHGTPLRSRAMAAYAGQLALNGAWSPLFFALGWRGIALADIIALDVAILATMALIARHHRAAAYLLVPYLLWSLFATALNASYWALNR